MTHSIKNLGYLSALIGLGMGMAATAAEAQSPVKNVLELFTSQGCSSCPPADKIAALIAKDDSTLVLTWHVQYWDHLGWQDTLGLKAADRRQKQYAATFQSRSIYTPQAVVNGAAGMVGSRGGEVNAALGSVPFPAYDLTIASSGGKLKIDCPDIALNSKAIVEVVTYAPKTLVQIERGENTGETVAYINAVTGISEAGVWTGKAETFNASLPSNKGDGVAVLARTVLENGQPGPVIAAAHLSSAELAALK
jgi:hypothetical protein